MTTNTFILFELFSFVPFCFSIPSALHSVVRTFIHFMKSIRCSSNTKEKYGDQSNGYLFHNITFFAILYVNRVHSQHQLLAVRKRMTSSAVCSLPVMAKISAAKRLASCSQRAFEKNVRPAME